MNHFEYYINEKERRPAGQVYLGAFLAAVLFFSFFFGSLLFFIIVLIISVFIFLDKSEKEGDEFGRVKVVFAEKNFAYGRRIYNYDEVKSFTLHDEIFGLEELHLRITFNAGGRTDLFIYAPTQMHSKNIYDIIAKSVKEDKKKVLSFTEQLFIKFF